MNVVFDSESAVRYAHRVRLPLADLIERQCGACGDVVFATRKQLNAFETDPAVDLPLKIICTRCGDALRDALRQRGYK